MNRADIIRIAEEAGFESNSLGMTYTSGSLSDLLERFAVLVATKEREACAKVLDEMAAKDKLSNYYVVAALAIRERGTRHE